MALNLTHLPDRVAHALRCYARARLVLAWLRVAAGVAAVVLAAALVAMALDLVLFLPRGTRVALSLGVVGFGLFALVGGALGLVFRRIGSRRTAYALEDAAGGDVAERLVTAEQVLPGDAAGGAVHVALIGRLAALTESHVASLQPVRLARDRGLVRRLCLCGALLLVAGLCGAGLGGRSVLLVRRLLNPLGNLPKPGFMRLSVTPETIVIGAGGEVVIQVRTEGDIPRLLRRVMRFAGADADRCVLTQTPGAVNELPAAQEVQALNRIRRDLFVLALTDVRESFSFRVRCGDAESEIRLAEVVAQPQVVNLRATVTPPAYTKLPVEAVERFDVPIRAFAASAVEVRFGADQTGTVCRVKHPDGSSEDVEADEAGEFLFSFTVSESGVYEITAVNSRGFECIEKPRLAVALREDQAPVVSLIQPIGNPVCMPGETVAFFAEAADDLGLVEAVIEIMINPGLDPDAAPKEEPVVFEAGGLAGALRHTLDLGPLGVAPGDEVVVLLRARDTGGNDGRSRAVTLRVAAFTAGENERRRLAALEVAAAAVAGLTNDTVRGVWAISEAAQASATRVGAAAGVPTESLRDSGTLLDFLELEHHFTDRPQDKEDLRLLSGVLRNRLAPVAPGSAVADLAAWNDACSRLLTYRTARLAALRLLGLRRETLALVGDGIAEAGDGGAQALAEAVADRVQADPEVLAFAAAMSEDRRLSRERNTGLHTAEAALENQLALGGDFAEAEALMAKIDKLKGEAAEAADQVAKGEKELQALAAASGREAAGAAAAAGAATAPRDLCEALGADTAMAVWRLRDRAAEKLEEAMIVETIREVAARYAERFAGKNVEAAASAKRLTLLAEAINASGGTVIALSRAVQARDSDAIADLQETVSVALRQMQREPARQAEAAKRLSEALARLHQTVAAWLPLLQQQAQLARADVRAWHDAIRRALAAAHTQTLTESAHAWLLADARLRGADPYAPLASRVEWLADAGLPSDAAHQAFEHALGAEALDADRRTAARLAAEAAAAGGEYGERAPDESAFLKRVADQEVGVAADHVFAGADWTAMRELCATVPCGHSASGAVAQVVARLERLETAVAAVKERDALQRMTSELGAIRLAVHRLMVANELWVSGAMEEREALNAVRLNRLLRAAWARFDSAAGGLPLDLARILAREADAAQLAEAEMVTQELVTRVRGLRLGLARAAADTAAAAADEALTASVRAWRGASWVRAARKSLAAGGLEVAVQKWAAEDESVARAVLARCEPAIVASVAAMERAESLLQSAPDRSTDYAAALQQAIAGVETLAKRSGGLARRVADEVEPDVNGLAQRIAAAKISDWSSETRARAALRVAEGKGRVERLLRRMRATQRETDGADAWGGGPEGAWARDRRIDGNHAQMRLSHEMQAWETRALICVLEAAETADAASRAMLLEEAEARFSGVLRVAASALGDSGDARTRGGGDAESQVRDPVVRWLLQQVDEARRELRREGSGGAYREVTERYLNTVEGFLRY